MERLSERHHSLQAKTRKKPGPSTLKDIEKLSTLAPASRLSNPVHAGYAEVLALGSWERFWCVVHSGALYLYQNHESPATTLTIILKGLSFCPMYVIVHFTFVEMILLLV